MISKTAISENLNVNDFGMGWGGPSPPVSSKNYEITMFSMIWGMGRGPLPPLTPKTTQKLRVQCFLGWGGSITSHLPKNWSNDLGNLVPQ